MTRLEPVLLVSKVLPSQTDAANTRTHTEVRVHRSRLLPQPHVLSSTFVRVASLQEHKSFSFVLVETWGLQVPAVQLLEARAEPRSPCLQSGQHSRSWFLLPASALLQASNTSMPMISLEDQFEARWAEAMALRKLCFVLLAAGQGANR